mgnify:CR=1 FL=1
MWNLFSEHDTYPKHGTCILYISLTLVSYLTGCQVSSTNTHTCGTNIRFFVLAKVITYHYQWPCQKRKPLRIVSCFCELNSTTQEHHCSHHLLLLCIISFQLLLHIPAVSLEPCSSPIFIFEFNCLPLASCMLCSKTSKCCSNCQFDV